MQHPSHRRPICCSIIAALLVPVGAMVASRGADAAPAAHVSPRAYCARVGTDDTLRAPPLSLAPALRRLFNLKGSFTLKSAYYRCAAGEVLVCWVGANLPCGKANTSRTLAGAAQWCRTHPNSNFIPMYVTGHDTPYSWRCMDDTARAGALIGKLDARGFFAEYWKRLK